MSADISETIARLRDLLNKAGDERWEVDPDHRPGMEYNNIICIEGDADLRVAFMAHDGPENQDRFDAKAALIAALRNAAPALLDAAEAGARARDAALEEAAAEADKAAKAVATFPNAPGPITECAAALAGDIANNIRALKGRPS